MTDANLEEAIDKTIQPRASGKGGIGGAHLNLVFWMAGTNELISPWWSRQRDWELRDFWKRIDYLAGAINTLEAMLTTIPLKVIPRDPNIRAHQKQAEAFTKMLINQSEFGDGWGAFYSKFIEDLVTQDNGAFAEIIGDGEPDGPIIGMPLGVAHLDSWRCRRTGDPEFPVVYESSAGPLTKLHRTRVLFGAQQPSPIETMYGVGFSAVSRCINNSQSLLDMLIFKQEKIGSRPQRQILVTSGGLDPDDVTSAFEQANENMDNQRLSRYSRTVVVGASGLENAGLEAVDLASLPDGFNEETSVSLGMAAIALAFSMDPRELWPGQASRSTRAEALISHIKQRGKGPGQIIQMTERGFNAKVLPSQLMLVFDFQDDAQDAQVAEIKNTRSTYHKRDVEFGLLDTRTVRQQMVEDGDLTEAQFIRLEMDDGRTLDGREVISIFFDPEHMEDLDLGVDDPLDIGSNDPQIMREAILARRTELLRDLAGANPGRRMDVEIAIAALDRLGSMYGAMTLPTGPAPEPEPEEEAEPQSAHLDEEEEEEEEPNPTGNTNLTQDDLDLKGQENAHADAARAIESAAISVERVNQKLLEQPRTKTREGSENGR